VAISVGAHLALAAGWLAFVREHRGDAKPRATFETRADVHLEFLRDDDPPAPVVRPHDAESPPPPVASAEPAPEVVPEGPPKALAFTVPHSLPKELLAMMKRPAPPAAIQTVAATIPKGPAWATSGSPIHGALDARQRVVYVLDASGSMGEWGKFDSARAALIATLKLQPETVRFQVVVYSGTAFTPLMSAPGECRPANAENVARLVETLERLPAPAGRSQHIEGIRLALGYRPDVLLLFTDGEDLPLGSIRGLLKQADRKTTLCAAKVSSRGVNSPVEVK